jgi:hypothetical protein
VNLGAWPEGVAYDPAGGVEPLELDAIISGGGASWPAVILAADKAARRSGWAARSAIAIAGAWAASGRSVILADLCFTDPELHDHLSTTNGEGLADILHFGASLKSVIQPAGSLGFHFLAPGAYVPDPEETLRDAGWEPLLEQVARSGSILVAYAPLKAPGIEMLAERVGQVVVLVGVPDASSTDGSVPGSTVQLVLRPPAAVPAPPAILDEDEDADEPGAARRPAPEAVGDDALHGIPHGGWPADDAGVAPDGDEPGVQAGLTPHEDPAGEPSSTAPAAGVEQAARARPSDAEFERIRLPRDGAREALIADLRQRQRDALMVPPSDAQGVGRGGIDSPVRLGGGTGAPDPAIEPQPADAGPAAAPTDPGRPVFTARTPSEPGADEAPPAESLLVRDPVPPRKSNRATIVVSLAVVLLLAAVAGAWHFWSGRTQREALQGAGEAVGATAPASSGLVPLPFSVAIEAHQDLPTAETRVAALREAEAGMGFYITPLLVDGTLYYRLMAGPLPDSVTAAATMDALLEAGHKTGASEWDIRSTPLAFLLGDFVTREEAEQRVEELRGLSIPSYIVAAPASDVSVTHRVYGGGFAGPAEAAVMRDLLQSTGQPDSLVERSGRSPR